MKRICIGAAVLAAATLATQVAGQGRNASAYPDNFHWLNEFNKAAIVVTVEEKIVPPELGRKVAAGLKKVIEDGAKPGARRPGDYLQYEPLLIAQAGESRARLLAKPLDSDNWWFAVCALVATLASLAVSRWIFQRALGSYRSASS